MYLTSESRLLYLTLKSYKKRTEGIYKIASGVFNEFSTNYDLIPFRFLHKNLFQHEIYFHKLCKFVHVSMENFNLFLKFLNISKIYKRKLD